ALGIFLQDMENDLVFAHRAEILDAQLASHLVELVHGHRLQFGDVQRRGGDFVFVFGCFAVAFALWNRLRWLLFWGLLFWWLKLRLRRWLGDCDVGSAVVITVCLTAFRQLRAFGFRLFRTGSWHSSI